MNKKKLAEVMDKVVKEISFLREAGQKEYAHTDDNAFANFERVSQYLNIPREKVLWTYLQKHLDGITSYLNGHCSQREPVTGRINDAIVYLIILRGMIEENEPVLQSSSGSLNQSPKACNCHANIKTGPCPVHSL